MFVVKNLKQFKGFCYSYSSLELRLACQDLLKDSNPQAKVKKLRELHEYCKTLENVEIEVPKDEKTIQELDQLSFGFPDNITFTNPKLMKKFCTDGKEIIRYLIPSLTEKLSIQNPLLDNKIPINVALVHALCHIEYNAMSMYCDMVSRFCEDKLADIEFIKDFIGVARDEADHFEMLNDRLQELGYHYGSIPVHSQLYENAEKSKTDVLKRIVITSLVHEAKGMDNGPRLLSKLLSMQDFKSEKLLQKILHDEVRHVAYGVQWFKTLCEKMEVNPREQFQKVTRELHLKINPPFNEEAREKAGFEKEWYVNMSN